MVKTVYVTLSDEEHADLKAEKDSRDMTWAEFLLAQMNGNNGDN